MKANRPLSLLAAVTTAASLLSCAAQSSIPGPESPAAIAQTASVPILNRSVFAHDGSISEADLQRSLASGIDLQFPARLGVVPMVGTFNAGETKTPIHVRNVASGLLAPRLAKSGWFRQVSNIESDLPNAGGIEGLRAIAARYRLRYLLLYSQRFDDASHLNNWAWTYPTVVGLFAAPGLTVESRGVVQADLLDARTGTVLFTVAEPVHANSVSWLIGAGRTQEQEEGAAVEKAIPLLADRVLKQTQALIAMADQAERERPVAKYLPPPVSDNAERAVSHPTPGVGD